VLSVLVGVWLLVPAFASTPGWPARAVRGSVVVRAVDRWAPTPPGSLATLGRLVGEAPFPQVFERLTSPDAGPPPSHGLSPLVTARVSGAVMKIEGRACDEIQEGSGFVAGSGLIVTNAHVVAGERATVVLTPDGRRFAATVVGFDPERDLAALRVRGLGIAPLPRANPQVDTSGAVIGYPGGGPEKESPARVSEQIVAKGTDIYRSSPTERDVLVLASSLAPGDSGGALFDAQGRVTGIAFAVDPSNTTTAYALTRGEVERGLGQFLASGGTSPVDTGPCLNQ
jgi:S1-C subfamily serine protease